MDRTYLICISAPLNAFAAERRSLFERILDMNHIPFGREDCPADASGADDIMRRRIAASD